MQTENSDQETNVHTNITIHGDVDPQHGRGMVTAVLQEHCGADEASAQLAADTAFPSGDQPASSAEILAVTRASSHLSPSMARANLQTLRADLATRSEQYVTVDPRGSVGAPPHVAIGGDA